MITLKFGPEETVYMASIINNLYLHTKTIELVTINLCKFLKVANFTLYLYTCLYVSLKETQVVKIKLANSHGKLRSVRPLYLLRFLCLG